MVRTNLKGDKRFIGKTNIEAARSGIAPELPDGNFATLHHLGQNSKGSLVEASRRYHGIDRGSSGHNALHSIYGKNKPHPEYPVNQKIFQKESSEYWKARVTE